jgi:hypothetical protein
MFTRVLLYPLTEAVTVGTFLSILRRESYWGIGFAAGSSETVPQKIANLHQKLSWLAPNVTGHCV